MSRIKDKISNYIDLTVLALDRAKDYIYYCAYRLFKLLFLLAPKCVIRQILIFLANLAYRLGAKRRRIAKANLDLVYEDRISEEEKEEIIKKSYISLLFNMYEFIENQDASREEIFSKVSVKNEEIIKDAISNRRKIIYITAHYGGWEIGVPYIALKYGKMVAVVKNMKNPYIQNMYKNSRVRNNIEMHDKKSSAKELVRGLKNNLPLAIMVDQHIGKGCEMNFLGKRDIVIDSSSRLALKFGAIIVPAFAVMNDFRSYTIEFCDPIDTKKIDFKDGDDRVLEIAKLQIQSVEKQIYKDPSQWLWQHKRWKRFYGHIYR